MGRTDGRVRLPAIVVVLACGALLGGCGNSRTSIPSLTRPAPVHGFRTLSFAAAGVSISAPDTWIVVPRRIPLVAVAGSGDAVIALWRYPRGMPPPASASDLAAARRSLFAAIQARQGSARVIGSGLTRIDGRPAIEFDALQTIAGSPVRVLSTHLFTAGAEVVLEEYAPPEQFAALRYPVFARVRQSLSLIGAGA